MPRPHGQVTAAHSGHLSGGAAKILAGMPHRHVFSCRHRSARCESRWGPVQIQRLRDRIGYAWNPDPLCYKRTAMTSEDLARSPISDDRTTRIDHDEPINEVEPRSQPVLNDNERQEITCHDLGHD